MTKTLIAAAILTLSSIQAMADIPEAKYFSVIREFGGTDNAALFIVLPNEGSLQLSNITGPGFLNGVRIGQLDQQAVNHLFLHSSNPMSQQEKNDLITQYNGAQALYFEGYNGA